MSEEQDEKCPCGDDTMFGCAFRPSRHCPLWNRLDDKPAPPDPDGDTKETP